MLPSRISEASEQRKGKSAWFVGSRALFDCLLTQLASLPSFPSSCVSHLFSFFQVEGGKEDESVTL